jgi:hypothetical protein
MTIWIFALAIPVALVGSALICWSKALSEKYIAWTTRLRSKSPYLKPPPKAQTAQLNSRIMLNLFRICGATLIAIAVWVAVAFSR